MSNEVRLVVFSLMFLLLVTISCSSEEPAPVNNPPEPEDSSLFFNGADLSFSPQINDAGTVFHDSLTQGTALSILKDHGMNLVRLRLWYNPPDSHSSLEEVLEFAKQIKAEGLSFMLDIHYSDWWADQGKQNVPAAWNNLNFTQLQDSVSAYTTDVITQLKNQNALPDIVQVGNEVNNGFLWNEGKINWNDDASWTSYCSLAQKGIDAVKAVDNNIKAMIHFAGLSGAAEFYEHLQQNNLQFDLIGLSYYPFWHSTDLADVRDKLEELADIFHKDIIIVETGYPWTFAWNDYTDNIIGNSAALIDGYPASPEGQSGYLDTLKAILKSVGNNHGVGFCYWAPDYVAFNGPTATDGSVWENVALFDFENKALPALNSFGR